MNYNCHVYRCASTNKYDLSDKVCVFWHENDANQISYYEIDLGKCYYPNEYCPNEVLDRKGFSTCQDRHASSEFEINAGLDKEKCKVDSDCKSRNCTKDLICKGKEKDETCTSNNECKIGLYCKNNSSCQEQEKEAEKCVMDADCKNNAGCLGEEGKKICVKYYSLPDETKVLDANGRRFCKSNFSVNGICVKHRRVSEDSCIGKQIKCQYNYVLQGQTKPVEFEQDCQCSPNDFDKMFCPLGGEKPEWDKLTASYVEYYDSIVDKKHTILRNFFPKDLKTKQYEIEKYPKFRGADECYKNYVLNGSYIIMSIWIMITSAIFMF
jgi:hypothetical protein